MMEKISRVKDCLLKTARGLIPGLSVNGEETGNDQNNELTDKEKKIIEKRDHDVEALRHAHADVQDTVTHVLETFSKTSDKAIEMVKLNGVVISVLVAASTQVDNPMEYVNSATWLSAIFFLTSIILGLVGYLSRNVVAGLGTQDILLERKLTEKEYLCWLLEEEYDRWLNSVLEKQRCKSLYVQISIILFIAALLLFLAAIYLAL